MLKNSIKSKVILIGSGQHGRVVRNSLKYAKSYSFAGFLDDFTKKTSDNLILGKISDFAKFKDDHLFHIAFGDKKRKEVFELLKKQGCSFANIIHPQAYLEKDVILGEGVFIGANVYINIGSKIEDNVIINNSCTVEHDNLIGKHSQLTPGVITGGGVKIEENVFIGLGARLRDHIEIGDNSTVGMGSTITKNVKKNTTIYNKLSNQEKSSVS